MSAQDTTRQSKEVFETTIVKTIGYKYLLYLPKGYSENGKTKWPAILFLHGAGERGNNLDMVKLHGPPKIAEKKDLPFIIISPQCPAGQYWDVDILEALIQHAISKYSIDESRLYLTGLSMGGYGTWNLAVKYPQRFAAIAPICGGGDSSKVCNIKNIPTWAFHGTQDKAVPFKMSEDMVNALKRCGGNVEFTIIQDGGHDVWTAAYDNPLLFEWFLKYTNANFKNEVKPETEKKESGKKKKKKA
ncbi:MAG: prolyl oligopeptidase family serine peptidase [Cytophagaceae bacterium]|nr:prolyl oligopeptidase family serine peptidase [Cytophagaceae bacterium]